MRQLQFSSAERPHWVRIPWIVAAAVCFSIVGLACLKSLGGPLNVDFTMFWGGRELAYLPPYRLLITPLAWLPYGLAFCTWIAATGALYVLACGRNRLPGFANPAAAFNGMIGQNGFLTAAILFTGLRVLTSRPWLGGAILGLLIIKPHLALILPVAVVAARAWKAIPAAIGTIGLLFGVSFFAFGAQSFARSLEVGSNYARFLESGGAWNWNELASFYALGRWLGLPEGVAWLLHGAIAIGAMVGVWIAWRQDRRGKIPLTSAATLLISPYLFTYDAVLLTLALGWLRGPKAGVVGILLVVPLMRVFVHEDWPNTAPLAAAFAVGTILFEARTK